MKLLKACGGFLAGLLVFWVAATFMILILEEITLRDSGKLRSENELNEVLRKEKAVLGLDAIPITIAFSDESPLFAVTRTIRQCDKIYGCIYKIEIGAKRNFKNAVKHELYHIYDGHSFYNGMSWTDLIFYFFFYEPQAMLYTMFGWRL